MLIDAASSWKPRFWRERKYTLHPLCICLSLIKTQWPYTCQRCDMRDLGGDSKCCFWWTLRENSLSRVPLCYLLGVGGPWWNCRSRVLQGCYWSIVFYLHPLSRMISSSFIALYIFCQPLSHSSPVQHSLPSSRCCPLNITKCILSKLNFQPNAKSVLYFHHSPFQADGHSISQMLRSNTEHSGLYWFLSYTQFLIHQEITIALLHNMSSI